MPELAPVMMNDAKPAVDAAANGDMVRRPDLDLANPARRKLAHPEVAAVQFADIGDGARLLRRDQHESTSRREFCKKHGTLNIESRPISPLPGGRSENGPSARQW